MNLRDADWLDVSSPDSHDHHEQKQSNTLVTEATKTAQASLRAGFDIDHSSPWEPGSRRRKLAALTVVLAILGVVGWGLSALGGADDPAKSLPRASSTTLATTRNGTATEVGDGANGAGGGAKIVVALSGRVARPGLYELAEGARLAELLDQAGGVEADADLRDLNLAQRLPDEANVYVPRVGEEPRPIPGGLSASAETPGSGSGGSGSNAKINLNTADEKALEELPGVGPATAKAIVAHRTKQGRFRSVDDLLNVKGIGEAKLEALRDQATV